MARIYMRDFLTLDLRTADKTLIQCDKEAGGTSLLVRVAATHAGIINGNYRFYRPDKMQAGTSSWCDSGVYPRPVLANHDEDGAPLGRVLSAKYVDLSYLYRADYPILSDSLFYCSDAKKRMDMFQTVDWVVDSLSDLPGYQGLGMIELGLKVTEPSAIARVLRKEYLTVSVGFATDSAICSVCHQDWAVDDRCEHELGKKYKGSAAFVISGSMDFNEVSFVNSPADPFATTLSIEKLTDQVNRSFFLGLSTKDQNKRVNAAGIFLTDSIADALYSSDIEMLGDLHMKLDLKLIAEEIRTGVVEDRALAIRLDLSAYKGETDAENKDAKKLLSTIKAKIKSNAWGVVVTPVVEDASSVDVVTDAERAAVAAELLASETRLTDAANAAPVVLVAPVDASMSTLVLSDNLTKIFQSLELKDANESLKKVVANLEMEYAGLEVNAKRYLRYAISGLTSSWYDREEFDAYMVALTKDTDKLITTQKEQDELHAAIEGYDASETNLKSELDAEEKAKVLIVRRYKDSLSSLIVMHKALTGAKGFTGLNKDQIQAEIVKRSSRDLSSLQDMRDEIFEELQWAVPIETFKAPVLGLAIADSATLSGSALPAANKVTDALVAPAADVTVLRNIPMTRREQQEAAAYARYAAASTPVA